MTNINRINHNVYVPQQTNTKSVQENTEKQAQPASQHASTSYVPADQILDLMANNVVQPGINPVQSDNAQATENSKRVIEISKWVTPEQAREIGKFANDAMWGSDGLIAIQNEVKSLFPKLSDKAAIDLADGSFNLTKMGEEYKLE